MDTKFKEMLADVLEINASDINDSYILDVEGNWDSIAVLTTMSLIDDAYGIEIDGDDVALCESAIELYELIDKTK
jgi:acyl carrier protein